MSDFAERLYALLPAIHRIRDDKQGKPLHALLALIAREFEAIEENIEQLYDDQFIETCAEWVAPYIGDLVGYRPLHPNPRENSTAISARAEVANTIAYRRRKGTAAMLEQLARDITDAPARVVEFFEQLTTTQYMNHIRLHAQATPDMRSTSRLQQLDGPFNTIAHTAEMRSPERGAGRYNIPNVGIFLWRLRAFALTDVPLTPDPGDASGRRFRFNPLGADQPLFRHPVSERMISHIAEPENVPDPIGLRQMAQAIPVGASQPGMARDYGDSILLSRPDPDPAKPPVAISETEICVCDLRDVAGGWAHEDLAGSVHKDKIAIDPQRGRVLLGANVSGTILATFYSGFSRPIGGGKYARGPEQQLPPSASHGEALQPLLDSLSAGGQLTIDDSLTYSQTPTFKVDAATGSGDPGVEATVTARRGARPLIAAGGDLTLDIGARGKLVLDGLVISGGALTLAATADNEKRELVLRHCTLVPGLNLQTNGDAVAPGSPSLVIANAFASVRLEKCIVGAIRVDGDAKLELSDCILDAGAPDAVALEGILPGTPGPELTITDSTVIGKVSARVMHHASNTIFFARLADPDPWKAPVWAERKQEGCVRFCLVPKGSLVPARFRCVPDSDHPDVLPYFTSVRYGDPGYAQLLRATDRSLREGADDDGEIGVMHALYQPQREANLRIRLDEYLRFGLRAGFFYVT